jgi:hypothetical protein
MMPVRPLTNRRNRRYSVELSRSPRLKVAGSNPALVWPIGAAARLRTAHGPLAVPLGRPRPAAGTSAQITVNRRTRCWSIACNSIGGASASPPKHEPRQRRSAPCDACSSSTAGAPTGDDTHACSRAEAGVIVSRLTPMTSPNSLTAYRSPRSDEVAALRCRCAGGGSAWDGCLVQRARTRTASCDELSVHVGSE